MNRCENALRPNRAARALSVSLAATAALVAAVPAHAAADLCVVVRGLCASRHVGTMAELKAAVGPAVERLVSEAEAAAASSPIFKLADPALSAAAATRLRDGQVADAGPVAVPGSRSRAGGDPIKPAPDTGRFGRPEVGGDPVLRGLGQVTPERNTVGGAAGKAQDGLRTAMPDRGSLTRQGGTTPGTPGPGTLLDFSAPNGHGGVTRTTTGADGTVKVVETGGTRQGGSYQQVDLFYGGGAHTRIATVFSPTGQYAFQGYATRRSSTDLYVISIAESNDMGNEGSWHTIGNPQRHHTPSFFGVRPTMPPGTNVDPDATGGRSRQPPVCAFANPDCDMPLMVRFHNDRPDRRGRPSETAGTAVPRLNTDRHGNVVNPGLEPAAGGAVTSTGRSARSVDGGRLTNPADQRGGTGAGSEGSGRGGPPKPP